MIPVLRIEAVTKRFGAVVAADSVSLEIGDNECVALLGPSGCGKTTLLRIMAGLEQADSGRVFIGAEDMTARPAHARPVNMMFQSYALFPHMTVHQNVAFGLKQDGVGGAALAGRVDEALKAVELDALGARKPHQLSGGQRQRAALARCIAKRPRVLLLDEPMAALDKHLRERTQLELLALRKRLGVSFVVVTHDQGEAMAMADRVAVMQHGRILQVDTPRDLYERPSTVEVARFFGDINIWSGVARSESAVEIADLGITAQVTGQLAPGQNVSIALRPERISLGDGGGQGIAGRIEDMVYLGSGTTYFARSLQGGLVRVLAPSDGRVFARGDAVALDWHPSALMVLVS
jgi:putrescine transport system ATP-binding protein